VQPWGGVYQVLAEAMMSWSYLVLAIVLEVSATTSMKLSQGFTKVLPSNADCRELVRLP
jgi:Small Multidrug Resistance protein